MKSKRAYYDYKVHVGTDAEQVFVLSCHATSDNVYNGHELARILAETQLPTATLAVVDKGYASAANRCIVTERGFMYKANVGRPPR